MCVNFEINLAMRNLIYLLFLVLYSILFWQEGLGINLIIFSLLSLGFLRLESKQTFRKSESLVLLSLILASVSLLLYHSTLSIIVFFLAFSTYLSFLQLGSFSVLEAFVNSFISFFSLRGPLLPEPLLKKAAPSKALLYMRIAILPLLIFFVFFLLFKEGNQIFGQWSDAVFGSFFSYLDGLDMTYLFFLLLGLLLLRWIFKDKRRRFLTLNESNFISRKSKKKGLGSFTNLSLKREYQSAFLLFTMLNLLLFIVNFIDIKWVWFQFYIPESFSLKDFVHEGVGYLIFSLVLSAGLIFYYFRANLNFYPKNGWLRFLAQIWVLQNAVLALSVARRTFYYIGFHGLADRRIAVLVFIAIILFALGLLVYKLSTKRNNSYVLKQSSGFTLAFLAALSLVNWDQRVAVYNLNHGQANEIDVAHYLTLSPRIYPTLYANLERIEYQIERHLENEVRWVYIDSIEEFKTRLDKRKEQFLLTERRQSWRSWNYADAQAIRELKL